MVFMLHIVLRAFDRISKRIMGLHDSVEAETIAGLGIVGMVALSKITKYSLYCVRDGIRADFQNFVIVGECNGVHNLSPPERPRHRPCSPRRRVREVSGIICANSPVGAYDL